MTALETYNGSDGDATKLLYAKLAALGPIGEVALNLFRAQKCSARAKGYRRRVHKSEAYGRKNWSITNLCTALQQHAGALNIAWGWKQDATQEVHNWVLYVNLPFNLPPQTNPSEPGLQVSFHSDSRGLGPDYPGEWDQSHQSASRIVIWVGFLLGENGPMPSCRTVTPTKPDSVSQLPML